MKRITQIKWTWQKIVTSVLTVLGIGTLTACYGVMPGYSGVYGRVTTGADEDEDGEKDGIQGIKVQLVRGSEILDGTTSGTDGSFDLNSDTISEVECELIFTDIDGEENGRWKSKRETVKTSQIYSIDENEFVLEKDE